MEKARTFDAEAFRLHTKRGNNKEGHCFISHWWCHGIWNAWFPFYNATTNIYSER